MAASQMQASVTLPTFSSTGDTQSWSSALIFAIVRTFNRMIVNINLLANGQITQLQLTVQHVAPIGPADGFIAYADGTDWNPGSGKGVYEYRTGAWYKL